MGLYGIIWNLFEIFTLIIVCDKFDEHQKNYYGVENHSFPIFLKLPPMLWKIILKAEG
jgi:hypothetical protein